MFFKKCNERKKERNVTASKNSNHCAILSCKRETKVQLACDTNALLVNWQYKTNNFCKILAPLPLRRAKLMKGGNCKT